MIDKHWSVTVRINHDQVLTIESNYLYGNSYFTEEQKEIIRQCAESLIGFIGIDKSEIDQPLEYTEIPF